MAVAPVYESITLPRQKSRSATSASPTFSPSPPAPPSSTAPAPQTANVTFHPLAGSGGGGGGSIFSSLKRMGKKRKRKRDTRRHTIQKIMGVEEQAEGIPRYAGEATAYDTRTWPLKRGRRKKTSPKSGNGAEAMAYMKNPLLKVIDTECSGEESITPYAVSEGPSTNHVRGHCRFLSLGSVLSFDLPKDRTLIPSIQDIITIAPPDSKTGAGTDLDPLSQRHTVLSSFKQTRPTPAIRSAGISSPDAQTSMEVKDLPDVDRGFQSLLPLSQEEEEVVEEEDQTVPCDELSKMQLCLHELAEQEWDKMSPEVQTRAAEGNGETQPSHNPIYVNQAQNRAGHKHKCPSVHTLIRDLNGHRYHNSTRPRGVHGDGPGPQGPSQASHMVVNLKSTVSVSFCPDSADSGFSTSSSIRLCTNAPCPDNPRPTGVVGRLVSLEVEAIDCTKRREEDTATSAGQPPDPAEKRPVHVDRRQFEEEEEELEDIWNQTTKYRQSICSDIMYQPRQEEAEPSDQSGGPGSRSPSTKAPAVLYRNLATASAPNLLVAEFKLPSHVQSLLGYDKEQSPRGHHLPLGTGDRRSWAAFPDRGPAGKSAVTVNETASDPVKLPDVGDNQRYIYQYREEEEEEEEEEEVAKVGEEVDEDTGCSKDQSMSLLSVHMGLDGICQQRTIPQSLDSMEKQEVPVATAGRCITLSGKPELLSMEGTLERKQKLQLGGKKAASRSWNSYHTVLHRHTLCFYVDRKDTLRSSACGLPLNLTGAECSPAPEYTKKPNCFRLWLRDGSEYLLSASSRFMMKKWMMKIQANTGQSESVSSLSRVPFEQDVPLSLKPSLCSDRRGPAKCHRSSQHDVTSTPPRRKPLGTAETKEIAVLAREFTHMQQGHLRTDEQSAVSSSDGGRCDDDEGGLNRTMTHRLSGAPRDNTSHSPGSRASGSHEWLGSKHRSHSFTSATFQRIKPMPRTPGGGGLEIGSNYSVTLVVGEASSSADSPAVSRSSAPPPPASAGWQWDPYQDSALRSYASLPWPRNKSVFKKFFGKGDI